VAFDQYAIKQQGKCQGHGVREPQRNQRAVRNFVPSRHQQQSCRGGCPSSAEARSQRLIPVAESRYWRGITVPIMSFVRGG
jgi:hypothetical protein